MNDRDYRDKLIEWDKASLDRRVERWKQLVPASYDVTLPNLAWHFITEVDSMFRGGYFIGAILICAGITELVLADQMRSKMRMTQEEVERFGLKRLVILGHRLGILDDKETTQLNKLRELRNSLIHGNAGRLTQMAKKRYQSLGLDASDLDAEFYFLLSTWGEGIYQDALQYQRLVKDLTVRLYGAKP